MRSAKKAVENKIPKIVHHIWTSGDRMKPEWDKFRLSWMRCNPDYTFIMWDMDKIRSHYCDMDESIVKLMESDMHYEVKMDVITWVILYAYGGIKADVDMWCQKSFDPLLKYESFCGMYESIYNEKNTIMPCVACMGTAQGNPVIKTIGNVILNSVLKNWKKCYKQSLYEYCEVPALPYMERDFEKVFDKSAFFPFSWQELGMRDQSFPESYAVHFWGGCNPGGWVEDVGGILSNSIWGGKKSELSKLR